MKINMPVTGQEVEYAKDVRIISTTDPKGAITAYNQTFLDISGFTPEELLGKNHNVVRHPDMPPAAFENLWTTLKADKPWMGLVKNRCKNGDHYWVDAFVLPVEYQGKVYEYQSVRSKPEPRWVTRAEKIYSKLLAGKKPFGHSLKWAHKVFLTVIAGFMLPVLAALFFPAFIIVASILGMVLSTASITMLLRPVKNLEAESRDIFNNPLMEQIYFGHRDEFAAIQLAMKMLRSQLDAVVSRIDYSGAELSDVAKGMADTAAQSQECVAKQREALAGMGSAVVQVSSSIQEVAVHANDTATATSEAQDKVNNSKQQINENVRSITQLSDDIAAVEEVINQLEKESETISGVLDVIRGIAEQTNLLALNAAIEAARAGEQGRGFAVVADEVRTLAVRTQDSIGEIEEMIHRIQESAKHGATSMAKSSTDARSNADQAHQLTSLLDVIAGAVETVSDMTSQIATITEEQSAAAQEITDTISNIESDFDLAVKFSDKSHQVSNEVSRLTEQQAKLVSQFRK